MFLQIGTWRSLTLGIFRGIIFFIERRWGKKNEEINTENKSDVATHVHQLQLILLIIGAVVFCGTIVHLVFEIMVLIKALPLLQDAKFIVIDEGNLTRISNYSYFITKT